MKNALLLSFLIAALSACTNTNTYYTGGGTECPGLGAQGTAFPTNLSSWPGYSAAQWSDLTAPNSTNGLNPQSGNYTYLNSGIYYYDDTTAFEIEISEAQDSTAASGYSQGVSCVFNFSNIAPSMAGNATHLMTSLVYNTTTSLWTATQETLGWSWVGASLGAGSTPITLPPSTTNVDPESLFSDYSAASDANNTNNLYLWCQGTCLPSNLIRVYVVRGFKQSKTAPFNMNQLNASYIWIANPTSTAASLHFGQISPLTAQH